MQRTYVFITFRLFRVDSKQIPFLVFNGISEIFDVDEWPVDVLNR